MKIVFILLTIAMLGQVSLAGVVGRFKREGDASWTDLMKVMRTVADAIGPAVKQTLEQLPQTDAYAKYREELEEFMEAYNEFKSKRGLCMGKLGTLFEKYNAMIDEIQKEDAPVEAKKVDELLDKYGSEKLENEAKQFFEIKAKLDKYNKLEGEDEAEIDEVEGLQLLSMMLEYC